MVNGDCKCKVGGFGRVRSMRWGRVEVDGRNEDGDGDGDDEDCGRNGNRRRSCWAPEILLGL